MSRLVSSRLVSSRLVAAALGAVMSSDPARADCTLPRALVLPRAMDPALRCEHDQDDNGLDDEMELELGRCLAPAFRFQTGHVEPPTRVLFNAHGRIPRGGDGQAVGPMELVFKYVYLWPSDDGFTLMNCW